MCISFDHGSIDITNTNTHTYIVCNTYSTSTDTNVILTQEVLQKEGESRNDLLLHQQLHPPPNSLTPYPNRWRLSKTLKHSVLGSIYGTTRPAPLTSISLRWSTRLAMEEEMLRHSESSLPTISLSLNNCTHPSRHWVCVGVSREYHKHA